MKDCARRYAEFLLASALLAGACAGTRAAGAPERAANSASIDAQASCPVNRISTAEARPLVDEYCVSCHSPNGAAGEDYDFRSDAAIILRRRNIEAKLRLHVMPPPSARQLSSADRAALRCWAQD
jgi:uncharacterized membrane protein